MFFPKNIKQVLPIVAGLLVGAGLLALFVANRQEPIHDQTAAIVPILTTIEVQPVVFRLEARSHGVVRPAETWQAIASVGGKVIEIHPDLDSGKLLPADTLLLALDPRRYQLAIAAAQAELASLAAEQALLDTEEENTRLLVDLERERLTLAERELARIHSLAGSGAISQSQQDEQLRTTLAQRQAVTTLDNQLGLIPSRRQRVDAQTDLTATRLAQARRDLEDTRFFAPYDLRLAQVDVALHQNVAAGQRLFQADSIEAVEIETQVPLAMLRRLMAAVPQHVRPPDPFDLGEFFDFSSLRAELFLVGIDAAPWPGRVSRLASGLDPKTRTARVVVVVDQPYRNADPPLRPILQRDMYLRVLLSAESPEPLMVVPASAVHQGEVYLVDGHDLLQRRAVAVGFTQNDLAVITAGLEPGERVIVDDPGPALGGMKVVAHRNTEIELQLRRRAAGEGQ
jgi:RND family efflux transporter MFP subunit